MRNSHLCKSRIIDNMRNKRIYHIDSRQRVSGTNSNFSYKLENMPPNANRCCVLQASIPKSYYLIAEGKNTFTLEEDSTQVVISLDVGDYSRRGIQTHLTTLLNNNSPNGYTYSIDYSTGTETAQTGKFTFNVSDNGGIQPKFIFGDYIAEELGFEFNNEYDFSGNTLTSLDVVKLIREDTLYIHSDIATNINDNILQEIFAVQNDAFSSIVFQQFNHDLNAREITHKDKNVYNFYLTNESGSDEIDLNGINWIIVLAVWADNTEQNAENKKLLSMISQTL